jgi:hypothetical protein
MYRPHYRRKTAVTAVFPSSPLPCSSLVQSDVSKLKRLNCIDRQQVAAAEPFECTFKTSLHAGSLETEREDLEIVRGPFERLLNYDSAGTSHTSVEVFHDVVSRGQAR